MAFLRRHHLKLLWAVVVVALVAGNVGGGLVGYLAHDSIQHALGARKDRAAVIRAHYHPVSAQELRSAGGAGGVIDLSYLFGPVLNQGATNACGSFSLTAILYALRIERGEQPATYFSPWFHRYNTVGLTDSYTTMDDNITAAYTGGMVYHFRQESPGVPTQDAYLHADAKSAYYQIVSLGGPSTFDTIRYELARGHPVWLLNVVRDGMWYLSPTNPYTDNGGAYHGAHFEVAVGVYGNYIKIRNSWGSGYGQNGYYYMSAQGINATTEEAAIVTIGPRVIWPAPAPTATPTVRVWPTARPTVRPSARARATVAPPGHPSPTPTQKALSGQLGQRHGQYVQTVPQQLRSLPRGDSTRLILVRKNWELRRGKKASTPHWLYLCTLNGHCGYDYVRNVRPR